MDVNLDELDQVLDGARQAPLSEADLRQTEGLHCMRWRRCWYGPRNTEKTSAVLEKSEGSEAGTGNFSRIPIHPHRLDTDAMAPRRLAASGQVNIRHQNLKHGDRCPDCGKGNVYGQKEPKVLVRIVGQAPLSPTVYSLGARARRSAHGSVHQRHRVDRAGPEDPRCTSPGASLPARTIGDVLKRRGQGAESADSNVRCSVAERAEITRGSGKYYRPTVLPTEDGSLWKWLRTSQRKCLYVLEVLGEVYRHDAEAREGGLAASGTTADPPTA